jgi:hypothetical protein
MTLLEIIKNKLEGKTILVNTRWRLINVKVTAYYNNEYTDEMLMLKSDNNKEDFRLVLEDEFEIITKE